MNRACYSNRLTELAAHPVAQAWVIVDIRASGRLLYSEPFD